MNYRLQLMYEGTKYAGWQRQPNAKTVQGELEKALSIATRENVVTFGVSRTDAGVHAADYTAHMHIEEEVDPWKLCRSLNALLEDDIRVKSVIPCPEDFHARFDAVKKTYIYKIDTSDYGNPFYKNFVWHVPGGLDTNAMKEAATHFLGTHDFYGFMAQGGSSKTFSREIYESTITEEDSLLTYRICGNGFLYNMVRIITGTLVFVGKGKIMPQDLPEIIASKDRTKAGMTAPAKGLTLLKAEYLAEKSL